MNDDKLIYILKKYFYIKVEEYFDNDGKVWGRYVSVQSMEDYKFQRWDTTASADLLNNQEDFEFFKKIFGNN